MRALLVCCVAVFVLGCEKETTPPPEEKPAAAVGKPEFHTNSLGHFLKKSHTVMIQKANKKDDAITFEERASIKAESVVEEILDSVGLEQTITGGDVRCPSDIVLNFANEKGYELGAVHLCTSADSIYSGFVAPGKKSREGFALADQKEFMAIIERYAN